MLKFNEAKCNVLHLGDKNPRHEYFIGDASNRTKLNVTNLEKDLGVHIDSELSFDKHVSTIVNKANSIVGLIRRSFSYLDGPLFKNGFHIKNLLR